jgi:GntR family transcriptional regulator
MNMILKNSPIPFYLQVAQILRDKISNGDYTVGDKIPSEEEIVNTYGIARMTARNAVTQLVSEGLVYRVHGVGAFVSRKKLRRDLNKLTGFFEDMKELGFNPTSKIIERERRLANQREQNLLGLRKNQEVFYINRIRYLDEEPIGLQSMVVPVHLVPNLDEIDLINTSFYRYLDNIDSPLEKANQKMEAVMATHISNELEISEDIPFFYFERVSFTKDEEPIELLDSYFRGDLYSYDITLYR